MCLGTHTWRLEDNLGCHSQEHHRPLSQGISLPCGSLGQTSWPASSRNPPVSVSKVLGLLVHAIIPIIFHRFWGTKLRSLARHTLYRLSCLLSFGVGFLRHHVVIKARAWSLNSISAFLWAGLALSQLFLPFFFVRPSLESWPWLSRTNCDSEIDKPLLFIF